MQEESTLLATTSISLQDLLAQVKAISNQLAEESFVEIPNNTKQGSTNEYNGKQIYGSSKKEHT